MADDNRIGVVGRVSQLQRQAASAPKASQIQIQTQTQAQRGMPGMQPPVPTPEQIQRVMAEQARQRQLDMAEAQRRASVIASGQSNEISAGRLDSVSGATVVKPAKTNSIDADSSSQQVSIRTDNPAQTMTKPIKQLKQFSEPEIDPKVIIPWYPIRSRGISVELEESIIELMPDDLANEGDPQAKVVLALLAEILYLRSVITNGQEFGQDETIKAAAFAANSIPDLSARIQRLEQSMYSQTVSLQAQARSIHEQVIEFQKQGLSSDEILTKITGKSHQKIESDGNQ